MNQFKKIALMSATAALFAFTSVACSKDTKVDDPAVEKKTDPGGDHPTGDHPKGDHPAKTDDHPAKTDEDDPEKKDGEHPAKTDEPAADHPSGDHPSK